jgi:hypothetical protein
VCTLMGSIFLANEKRVLLQLRHRSNSTVCQKRLGVAKLISVRLNIEWVGLVVYIWQEKLTNVRCILLDGTLRKLLPLVLHVEVRAKHCTKLYSRMTDAL